MLYLKSVATCKQQKTHVAIIAIYLCSDVTFLGKIMILLVYPFHLTHSKKRLFYKIHNIDVSDLSDCYMESTKRFCQQKNNITVDDYYHFAIFNTIIDV